jgi:NADH dehydrogenase [ubiquinone] 1 alpha subcomplex assembly factor 7
MGYMIGLMIYNNALQQDDSRTDIEVCPEAGVLVQSLVQRFEEDGGFFLLADYGHLGDKGDTFRVHLN